MRMIKFLRPSIDRRLEIELKQAYIDLRVAEEKVMSIQRRQNAWEERREQRGLR